MHGTIFVEVQQQPQYSGGYPALMEFIKNTMRYPPATRRLGVKGTVYTSFLVQKDGSVTDVHTVRGVHPELDAEAQRVIKLMQPWNPGCQNGKPVIVRFVIPIGFNTSTAEKRR